MNTLETIIEEPNEATGAQSKSQHRCEASKSGHIFENIHNSGEKLTESEANINRKDVESEDTSSEKRDASLERCRKQWETSPDQMKEISRSLSELNTSHNEKKDQKLVRSKRSKSKENLSESQINRSTLPPINSLSDSDSGKELPETCICEAMYKSNGDLYAMDNSTESSQWIVSRPIRNKPKDNLRLEGPMEMETTFKNSYDSTAKQINESISKGVGVVVPSHRVSEEDSYIERLKRLKAYELNSIKSSKKKPKHRPSTSLKAGGDGYFNTINKESYKNFVIIDEKSKEKAISSSNGKKKAGICCSTVSNIKLPKVDSTNREDNQLIGRRLSKEDKTQIESINKSMQTLTTSDRYEPKVSERTQTNGDFSAYVDTSAQTNYLPDYETTNRKQKSNNMSTLINQHKETAHQMGNDSQDVNTSWTIDSLEEHKRIYTRDVDSIKELGLMDRPQQQLEDIHREPIVEEKKTQESNGLRTEPTERSRDRTRVRYESKNYVQQQTRQKKHKNESSMRLFDGDMDFMTTTKTYFADKSPNRSDPNSKPMQRERTAGKKSRKSGRKRNLFRTSTEAEFYEPYGEKTTQTTYQKQFGDRLYCPAIDLGSQQSDFKYRGEASGHKFFLPAVNN